MFDRLSFTSLRIGLDMDKIGFIGWRKEPKAIVSRETPSSSLRQVSYGVMMELSDEHNPQ